MAELLDQPCGGRAGIADTVADEQRAISAVGQPQPTGFMTHLFGCHFEPCPYCPLQWLIVTPKWSRRHEAPC